MGSSARYCPKKWTKRCNGHCMAAIIAKINPTLRGWFGYFKQANIYQLSGLDSWVRMRLRSILRKRRKRKGRARGKDHQRWPNSYFAKLGLFSLEHAKVEEMSPGRGKVLTGEPYAINPHVRFGGRGGANQCVVPTPINKYLYSPVGTKMIKSYASLRLNDTKIPIPRLRDGYL